MAKHWASHALILSFVTLAIVGCQAKEPTINLPPPTFSGPVIAQKPAAKPAAPAPAPKVAAAKPSGPADWTPKSSPRAWRWVVIHHSATPAGSMAEFDRQHKAKGWDGVGYHFVIGNGTNTADGQVEVTPRWPVQKWGAHAKTSDNRYNDYGIGICMVGNFDVDRPTAAQMRSLSKLMAYLTRTYRIPAGNVVGHRDTKPTECPGRFVNIASIRQMAETAVASELAAAAEPDSGAATKVETASVELLRDATP